MTITHTTESPVTAEMSIGPPWQLRLYVVGQAPKSLAALINLKAICEQHLPEQYHIEVIDLLNTPEAAELDHVVAVPTTLKLNPPPQARVIGDLRDLEKARLGLGIALRLSSDTNGCA